MRVVFIPFRKGPPQGATGLGAVGHFASFADEKSCRHPDFTVTEIGHHLHNVETEIGNHPDFAATSIPGA